MSPAPEDVPEEQTLRFGHHRIRVQVRGEGSPLVLLNGVGAPLQLWQPLLNCLTGVRTIALDAPGSGGSDTPELPLSIQGHAALALQVLESLGYSRFSALGLSFGGMVAQELARMAGSRLDRLVLASTTCGWGGVPGSPAALFEIRTPERYYSRALFDTVAPEVIGGQNHVDGALLHEQSRVRRRQVPSHRGYLYQFWAAATWSSLPWLYSVGQPTLVITGDDDPLVPPINSQILASVLPRAKLHVVRGGGHLCLLERAPELAPRLAAFLG